MKPIEQLTDEELRIEIAEFCGWILEPSGKDNFGSHYNTFWRHPNKQGCHELPNYPTDLNAMWEAEEKLTKNQRMYYTENLLNNCENQFIHSTARQRAIAFVKTIRELKK